MRLPALLFLLILAAPPCLAQGTPPNPFASNYPSAPPSVVERAERARAAQVRRRPPLRRAEPGLLPPGSVPGR